MAKRKMFNLKIMWDFFLKGGKGRWNGKFQEVESVRESKGLKSREYIGLE